MSLPTYDQFIEPLLAHLATQTGPIHAQTVFSSLADSLSLSDEQRNERIPSGKQLTFHNRIGWANDRLKRAKFSVSPRRGYWQITDAGRDFLKANPRPWSDDLLEKLIDENIDTRLRPVSTTEGSAADSVNTAVSVNTSVAIAKQSPDEQIDSALRTINESVGTELLDIVMSRSPSFFEQLVLDVLHAAGLGNIRDDIRKVGRSGDGGIDGIISLDRLGLEKVYVQAKRWKSNIGRPEIQGFFGALAGLRAKKGVFITTSGFTREAREYAEQVSDSIVLIDGPRLAEMMIEYGQGVSHRTIKVPTIDSDYFDE